MAKRILRLPAVKIRTGKSRSTIYYEMGQGRFPLSIKLGLRAVGWDEAEIEAWLEARMSERKAA